MKRCPECRRDYYDDTLSFCLADGTELVYGLSDEEPATAILHTTDAVGEAPTRAQIHTTEQTAVLPSGATDFPKRGLDKRLLAIPLLLVIITLGGYFGYKYFSTNTKQIESIAVMPFVNESGTPDVEYLSDGMTETLIKSLSQLPNLSVKGRSSVFRYKGKDPDVKTVGKELGVQAVLYGRVIQRGDQLTLSLELLDALTENVIWSDKYDRKQADLISLQSEIARDVSNKLRAKLSGADEQKLAKNYTANAEAYQLYLQGRYHWNKRTKEGVNKAIEYFQKAIEKDPKYALAYAALADCYVVIPILPTREAKPKAKAAALKALELDPSLGEAHAVLGNVSFFNDWDWANAEREYKRAIELNPNYPTAHHWYGESLAAMGRFDESFAEYNRALELDPLSFAISTDLGLAYYYARQYDRAIEHLKKLVELDPAYVRTHEYLAGVYGEKEMFEEVLAEREKAAMLQGANSEEIAQAKAAFRNALKTSGAKGYWQKLLDFTKGEQQKGKSAYPMDMAFFYAKLNERDEAFRWLDKVFEDRDSGMAFLKVAPEWDNLRPDPRFQDLLRRIGLPQ